MDVRFFDLWRLFRNRFPVCSHSYGLRSDRKELSRNWGEAGLDRIIVLPPSSWRQADVHRTSAFRWVQVLSVFHKKEKTRKCVSFLVGEAGLEPARPQWTLEPESSESTNSTTRPSLFPWAPRFPSALEYNSTDSEICQHLFTYFFKLFYPILSSFTGLKSVFPTWQTLALVIIYIGKQFYSFLFGVIPKRPKGLPC